MTPIANPQGLLPLRDLLDLKPERPETALTLANAVDFPLDTVASFELPASIKRYFEAVLDAVAERRGRGFWVQSEYGGGKTHFIAALTALLGCSPKGQNALAEVWAAVNDEDVKARAHDFVGRRILPVAISCKGITPIDGQYSRALLSLLMEGIGASLAKFGLEDKVPVTADQELVSHFLQRPPEVRQQIDDWCEQRHGVSVTRAYEQEGPERAAELYRRYFRDAQGATPDVDQRVVDWLATLCARLENAGFDGLLVVIDEFATLQNAVPAGPDAAAYEDLLESLGWLVPQRLLLQASSTFGLYSIVASQRGHPVKLAERFTLMPLLAQDAARDYEIIVARRVRSLRPERYPDIDQYYHRYKLSYDTYAEMPLDRFREVFPFQPRVFDAIWRITAAGGDVAAARFGIAAVWDTLHQLGILDRRGLLTVSDLLHSEQFQHDLMASPNYREAFLAYQTCAAAASSLGFATEDLELAQRILDALFVDHLAYYRSPRWLSVHELAEAVLADSGTPFISPADQVLTVVRRLSGLRQIKYDPSLGARFEPEAGDGPTLEEVIAKEKAKINDADPRLVDEWAALLQATAPDLGLWSELPPDAPKTLRSLHKRIFYTGAAELRSSFLPHQGTAVLSHGSGRHFHIVVLSRPSVVNVDDINDPRVAVVIPGPLLPEEIDLCKTYVACQNVLADPNLMAGPNAASLRVGAEKEKKDSAKRIIARQAQAYRRGQIVSSTAVALNPNAIFNTTHWKSAVDTIADYLLGAVYDRRDEVVRWEQFKGSSRLDPATDASKVFSALVGGSTVGADTGAAHNFAYALGLCKPSAPGQLDLDGGHYAIATVLQSLAGAGPDGVATDCLYEKLCGVPYGVPHEIVTLWLLACVRAGAIGLEKRRIEIKLQHNAKARRKGGLPFPNNTITFMNVKDVQWANSLRDDFLTIQVSAEVPFGAVVEYAKVIDATLKVPAQPEQVEAEEERLKSAVAAAATRATETHTALAGLAQALAQPLPNEVADTLNGLAGALGLSGDYQRERLHAQLRQAYPTAQDLRSAWEKAHRWAQLAPHAADLASLHAFLKTLIARLSHAPGRYQQIVTKASLEALPRLSLPDLLADPSAAPAVVQVARAVRDAYINEYRIHHRDYFSEVSKLQTRLGEVKQRAAILGQLNKLRCAGPPALPDAAQRMDLMSNRLRLCPHAGSTEIEVGQDLTCRHEDCPLPGLDPLAVPPSSTVEPLVRELEQAIGQRVNAVKAKAVRAILEQSGEPSVVSFLAAIQAGQLDGLLEVLDDDLVSTIDALLEQARVRVCRSGVLARVVKRYPAIQRSQVDEVAAEVKHQLEVAFAELQQRHPEAVIQLQLTLEETP